MAIQEFEPQAEPEPTQFAIRQVHEDGEVFHHLIVDGNDTGKIDWEESPDGHTGYIDGLDGEIELDRLGVRGMAWLPIAQCMTKLHPDVTRVMHLDGVIDLVKPSDFGFETSGMPDSPVIK
jgi:hypothetical protein